MNHQACIKHQSSIINAQSSSSIKKYLRLSNFLAFWTQSRVLGVPDCLLVVPDCLLGVPDCLLGVPDCYWAFSAMDWAFPIAIGRSRLYIGRSETQHFQNFRPGDLKTWNLEIWKRRASKNDRDLSGQKCFNFRGVLIGDKTDA